MLRFLLTVLLSTFALPAAALTLQAQGRLTATGGGPAADGFYAVKFKLYASKDAQAPVWDETWLGLPVTSGMFFAELGTQDPVKSPLTTQVFIDNAELWITLQVSVEPELPRVRLTPVPYAVRAQFADQVLGALPGSQLADGSVAAKSVGFTYAASSSKGGPALDLQCTGCVGLEDVSADVLDPKNHPWGKASVAEGLDKSTAALTNLQSGITVKDGAVGLGKAPSATCGIDLASTGGLCVDGSPATVVLQAASDAEMAKLAKQGQMVVRSDTNQVHVYVGGKWRMLQYVANCGDGQVDPPETCDDKNADDTDGCVKCQKATCGDGAILAGVEACDGANLAGKSCQSEFGNEAKGVLACAKDCTKLDTSACVVPIGGETNPAVSCKAILASAPGSINGAYWLKDAGGKYKAYCDMSGGGWTLAVSWNYSTVPAQWGTFSQASADPKPGVKYAIPFLTVPASPVEFKAIYANGQSFAGTFSGGWEKSSTIGVRIKLTNGNYLIFEHQGCGGGVDTSTGYGICMVNGNYSDGYTCDGNSGQVSGSGLFNQCAQDENGCSQPSWELNGGVQVCGAKELVAVYFR